MRLCSDSLDFDAVHDLSDWAIAFESMPTGVEKRSCSECDFEELRFETFQEEFAQSARPSDHRRTPS
jgi:hypothetical protein